MNNNFKKLVIDSERLPISWERQRVAINTRISAEEKPKRRPVLIHRWVDIAALAVICLFVGWFLISHSLAPKYDVAVSEEEFYEGTEIIVEEPLPESLVVLNDFDQIKTDYDELIEFIAP